MYNSWQLKDVKKNLQKKKKETNKNKYLASINGENMGSKICTNRVRYPIARCNYK